MDETRRRGWDRETRRDLKGKTFDFRAGSELCMGLDDDFSSCIFYTSEDIDVVTWGESSNVAGFEI